MVAKTESQKATAMLMPYEALWGDFLDAHSQFYVLDTEKTHLAARWERAAYIVSNNAVQRVTAQNGTALWWVKSQRNSAEEYAVKLEPAECSCRDWCNWESGKEPSAPSGFCKHILAAHIHTAISAPPPPPAEATQAKETPMPEETTPATVPAHTFTEAPVSWNARFNMSGIDQQLTIRGTDVKTVLEEAKRFVDVLKLHQEHQREQAAQAAQERQGAASTQPGAPLTPVCPTCGSSDTAFKTWEARKADAAAGIKGRTAGSGWKCNPCDKFLPRGIAPAPAA